MEEGAYARNGEGGWHGGEVAREADTRAKARGTTGWGDGGKARSDCTEVGREMLLCNGGMVTTSFEGPEERCPAREKAAG